MATGRSGARNCTTTVGFDCSGLPLPFSLGSQPERFQALRTDQPPNPARYAPFSRFWPSGSTRPKTRTNRLCPHRASTKSRPKYALCTRAGRPHLPAPVARPGPPGPVGLDLGDAIVAVGLGQPKRLRPTSWLLSPPATSTEARRCRSIRYRLDKPGSRKTDRRHPGGRGDRLVREHPNRRGRRSQEAGSGGRPPRSVRSRLAGAGLPTIVTPSLYSAGEDFSGVALVIETLKAFWRRPEFHTDQGQRERRAAGG